RGEGVGDSMRREVSELVWIAYDVDRADAAVVAGLERQREIGARAHVADDAGAAVDGAEGKLQAGLLLAADADEEARDAIGAMEHGQRRGRLAAAVGPEFGVLGEHRHEALGIAAGGR